MSRPRRVIKGVEIGITLDEDVLTLVNLELFDPSKGRVAQTARSVLINQLLRDWLKARGVKC